MSLVKILYGEPKVHSNIFILFIGSILFPFPFQKVNAVGNENSSVPSLSVFTSFQSTLSMPAPSIVIIRASSKLLEKKALAAKKLAAKKKEMAKKKKAAKKSTTKKKKAAPKKKKAASKKTSRKK